MLHDQITPRVDRGLRWWRGLAPRQQQLLSLVAATAIVSLFLNTVYVPQRGMVRALKREFVSLKTRSESLEAQLPDINEEQRALDAATRALARLQHDVGALEAQLPQQSTMPDLLGQLVQLTAGYAIDFTAITPATRKASEQTPYERLDIELTFHAHYADIVNYVRRLERLSPFLDTTSVMIENLENGLSANANVTVVLSTLLGQGTHSRGLKAIAPLAVDPVEVRRDPFMSASRPGAEAHAAFVLSGITQRGERSTAIINDEIYGIGDRIGRQRVADILPNMVVLSDAGTQTVLTLDPEFGE